MGWIRVGGSAVAAVAVAAAGCGGDTIGMLVHGDPRGAPDASIRAGTGGAPEAGPPEGSGGLLIRPDATVRRGSGGAGFASPFSEAGFAECQAVAAAARRDVTAAI